MNYIMCEEFMVREIVCLQIQLNIPVHYSEPMGYASSMLAEPVGYSTSQCLKSQAPNSFSLWPQDLA